MYGLGNGSESGSMDDEEVRAALCGEQAGSSRRRASDDTWSQIKETAIEVRSTAFQYAGRILTSA